MIAALRGGESLKDAADYGAIPRATVYRWLARGRGKDLGQPAAEYEAFARHVAEARAEGLAFRVPLDDGLRHALSSPRAARRWLASASGGQGAQGQSATDEPPEEVPDDEDIPFPEAWAEGLLNPWPTPGRSVLHTVPADPYKALKRLLLQLRLDALRYSPRVWR